MSGVGESYAANMLATRGVRHEVDQIEQIGRGQVEVVAPVGAVKVAVERDDAKVIQKIKVLASAAGSRFYYRFPVKNKDGTTSNIEGPSIDCALAVARTWGNCDIDVRVQDEGDHWIFLARFRDFETGFTLSRAFQQRKGQVTMKTKDPGRALDIVFQIGQSKAVRNVICNALGDMTEFAFEEAKSSFVERIGKRVEYYRDKAIERLAELKIDVKRVEAIIGRVAKDWMAPELARIIAELTAIQDGMAAPEETYPLLVADAGPVAKEEPKRSDYDEKPAEKKEPETAQEQQLATETTTVEKTDAEAKIEDEAEFDFDKYLTECEADARKVKSLEDLVEIDQSTTAMLDKMGADTEVRRYWRTTIMNVQKELQNPPKGRGK